MHKDQADKLLRNAPFQVAKSMPNIPHSYTLAVKWESRELFERVVQFIRDNGVVEYFYSKPFTYYYLDGYKYWTMGNPLSKTKLINRAKV